MLSLDSELLRIDIISRPVLWEPAAASVLPLWRVLAARPAAARHQLLTNALAQIVRRSSKQQTIKGLATAGVRKSAQYVWAKLQKAMKK